MVSNTGVLKAVRASKKSKSGKKRKTANNNKGTTPKFKVHPDKK